MMRRIGMRAGLAALTFAYLGGVAAAQPKAAETPAAPSEAKDQALSEAKDQAPSEAKDQAPSAAKDQAPPLTREAIEAAAPDAASSDKASDKKPGRDKAPQPLTIKVQVLLDRAHVSPGAIDGRDGDNLRAALAAFAAMHDLPKGGDLTPKLFDALKATSAEPVVTPYTITEADAAGPYVDKIPPKMEDQSELKAMGYTSPREMLAERFHMAPDLLEALNPGADFGKAGTVLNVAAVPALEPGKPKDFAKSVKDVARIAVDKDNRQVRAFGKDGTLRASYPASIGSEEKPAPSGKATVKGVAFAPTYTYNPKYAFKGVKTKSTFTIAPGANNPVGIVWIDLSIPSYGIHGTPEPEKVGKTESHGCIRLTNWDAQDLASRTERGATVSFEAK